MSTARRGNTFENVVANRLEESGWLVGSRRHIGGAGDLIACHPDGRTWLIECKATKGMWDHFGPPDRQLMERTADRYDLTAWLAFRLPCDQIRWVHRSGWPAAKEA